MKRTKKQIETAYRLSIGKFTPDLWAIKQPRLSHAEKQELRHLWEVEKEARRTARQLHTLYRLKKQQQYQPLPPVHPCLLSGDLWAEIEEVHA